VVGLLTNALSKIDGAKTAKLLRQQLDAAPASWRYAQQRHAIDQERTARIEAAQKTHFDIVLGKLKVSTSLNQLKLVCEGQTDQPVFQQLMEQIPDTPQIVYDFVGGWSALRAKDPATFLLGCKEAIVVMDGDEGRHLAKPGKPLTKLGRSEQIRLDKAGVELNILMRNGIENYFPKHAIEKVTGTDLTPFFPISEERPIIEQLSEKGSTILYTVQRYLASQCSWIKPPSTGQTFYAKRQNAEVAKYMLVEKDVAGTDLYDILQHICQRARELDAD
jgi:hypothetical protein